MSSILTNLDANFSNAEVSVQYPCIEVVTENTAPLPLIVELLEAGDVPLLFESNGVTYELARVDASPLNLLKLLKVYPFKFIHGPGLISDIVTTNDLLEARAWTLQLSS